ncbi:periplasmic heavy metal sensor [Pontibacter oryzae]|uniref:Periplasmic heavy metal sensor n=1 Tax=Pontibacter oryzae TaxID=2304593 RepID=A0A399RWL7_9BACT|nr:periplasmic heavy metal sensor [Pontibacter oryzae]RIJ34217.1 periplasmic heavy metal sensor [Pontibacter oryzae]
MSKLKLLSIAAIGLLVLNLFLVGFLFFRHNPHPTGGRPPFAQEGPRHQIIEQLHLDEAQVQQYEALIDEHKRAIQDLNDQVRETKSELYLTLAEGNASSKDSLIKELGSLQQEIETVHYNHFVSLRKLCKPDQLRYFETLTTNLADYFDQARTAPRRPE